MTKTVMTVDDSPTIRQNISFVLSDAGYEVMEAVDGADAAKKLGSIRIDLFISDVHMPNMNGIDLTKNNPGECGNEVHSSGATDHRIPAGKKNGGESSGSDGLDRETI